MLFFFSKVQRGRASGFECDCEIWEPRVITRVFFKRERSEIFKNKEGKSNFFLNFGPEYLLKLSTKIQNFWSNWKFPVPITTFLFWVSRKRERNRAKSGLKVDETGKQFRKKIRRHGEERARAVHARVPCASHTHACSARAWAKKNLFCFRAVSNPGLKCEISMEVPAGLRLKRMAI